MRIDCEIEPRISPINVHNDNPKKGRCILWMNPATGGYMYIRAVVTNVLLHSNYGPISGP
jgi:hypothetical protein